MMSMERVNSQFGETLRPEPWVYDVVPFNSDQPDGLHSRTGIYGHFEPTDQYRFDRELTPLDVLQLAAEKIPGAGISFSYRAEHLGSAAIEHNRRAAQLRRRSAIDSPETATFVAVLVHGASVEQLEEARQLVIASSDESRQAWLAQLINARPKNKREEKIERKELSPPPPVYLTPRPRPTTQDYQFIAAYQEP